MTLETMTLGALIGYLAGSAPSPEVINDLRERKPEFYDIIDINLSTARDNEEYTKSGTFIWIDNQFARGSVTLRLNEPTFKELDLRRQRYISGPFYRFFITNVAGVGIIRLFISRGYQAASEPIEAINMAELAARLGSPVVFDRRGDVMLINDFEDGIAGLETDISGTGAEVAWSSERSFRGGYSCKMTGGSTPDYYAEIKKTLPFPTLSKIGYEGAFTSDSNMEKLEMYLNFYTTTLLLSFGYKYDLAASAAYLLTPGDVWTEIASGLDPYHSSYSFNFSKIVIDTPNLKYDRLITGPRIYDLSAYSCSYSVDLGRARMEMIFKFYSQAAVNAVMYLDSTIVTQNEP